MKKINVEKVMEKIEEEIKVNKEKRIEEIKANKESLMKKTVEEIGISEDEMKENGMFNILDLMFQAKEKEALERMREEEKEQMICALDIFNAINEIKEEEERKEKEKESQK